MSQTRQQILILHLALPSLESDTVAWALYDGATPSGTPPMQSGDSYETPYPSVLEAMRDGWNVLQVPTLPLYTHGYEHESGHLPYEYVLERKVAFHE
ncbi:hypothetical protein KSC_085460 [Ktedonobacter sp. SOSP1-52]|uniref:hypothetical protein n=1 Tax=Ktedonobacter sp. SOSP1-52 TaxID=2778366 RepID=UPI001915C5AE|nr:hypothetical protein [Ktedonobacter sp. SOSP1-52]GHO69654.1 hypothetical protein KSC_085460 [Ktedonobacter sp. SOSP1-52]